MVYKSPYLSTDPFLIQLGEEAGMPYRVEGLLGIKECNKRFLLLFPYATNCFLEDKGCMSATEPLSESPLSWTIEVSLVRISFSKSLAKLKSREMPR